MASGRLPRPDIPFLLVLLSGWEWCGLAHIAVLSTSIRDLIAIVPYPRRLYQSALTHHRTPLAA
jgi:hypothetical protein